MAHDILYVKYDKLDENQQIAYDIMKRHAGFYHISDEISDNCITVMLAVNKNLGIESFKIEIISEKSFRIVGGNALGLIYGVGRLLHRGTRLLKNEYNVPDKELRGIYFATHFYNYYQSAPLDDISYYLEELVLWGANSILMWFDMHHYFGLNDLEAKKLMDRMKKIYEKAKCLGLKTSLTMLANEHYAGGDKELLASNSTEGTNYHAKLCGFYDTELCPSKPLGKKQILLAHEEILESFSEIGLDYVVLWPYDQGGCTCAECSPWGSNGFLNISKELSDVIREIHPEAKIILSTWRFDAFIHGEWSSFMKQIKDISKYFEMLMIDFPSPMIPDNLYEETKKYGLKLVGFPEISMLSATPWGGFGATPVPKNIEDNYNDTQTLHIGGFGYSEGIFEDINKVVLLGLYYGLDSQTEIIHDYFRYYFGEETVSDALEFINCLENSLPRDRINADGYVDNYPREDFVSKLPTFKLHNKEKIKRGYELASRIERKLSEKVRNSLRFQILFLRTVIYMELCESSGEINDKIDNYAKRLEKIYYAEKADYAVCPITKKAINENRGHI